ncbi:uncharacterized protein [Spinacia oleracea]|uniref:Phospholipase-like protein n=1 Tax=Spinacia oleracea TaxID=3562 RepID=A0A9R0JBW2_SPIOL|nr:uncharacterized protein LOC110803019 [Spinacia oleracea]
MVLTRSGGTPQKRKEYAEKRKYIKRKSLFGSPQLDDQDHPSPVSAPPPVTVIPQSTHSGARLLFSDVLKHHCQNTVTHSPKRRRTRMPKKDLETKNFEKLIVEVTEGLSPNIGENTSFIQNNLQGKYLSGSDAAQPDIPLSAVQHSEAVKLKMQSAVEREGTPGDAVNLQTVENISQGDADIDMEIDDTNSIEDTIFAMNNHKDQSSTKTTSLTLTELAQQMAVDDDIVNSVCDSSHVFVGGYKVKSEDSGLLGSILSKHGDIADNCNFKTPSVRSLFIQHVCDIVQTLKKTSIAFITTSELEKMVAGLSDIEGACIEVGWLKERLVEIYEAKKAIPMLGPSSELRKTQTERKFKIQCTKALVEEYKREIVIREEELRNLEEKLRMAESVLSVDEEEATTAEMVIGEYKDKLRRIVELGSLHCGLV